ncbi:hypothetical protein [Nocardia macrotermitis]|uniref:Uncharacterized protein n=1 Tax=Nocardia macrotermitis TaxID=2585198 RepID=A0A7K0D4X3_9NOCA|nr:hypothetical protein [Nocardia macrotermitis]MQY20767.1 hypothetical protein [Nocardia macrotermitis]
MDSAEIRHALIGARTVPEGRERTRRLETLAAAARGGVDRAAEAEVLLELVQAYTHAGERDLAPIAIVRLLRVFDEHPDATAELSRSVHWYMKWMTSDLIDNPAVPLGTVRRWFDELESRYRTAGYSLRPVLKLRSVLARDLGAHQEAARLRALALDAPRDEMTDCEACECNWSGSLSASMGQDVDALRRWAPVLDGRRRCAHEPHRVTAHALLPLVSTGDFDAARAAHLTGYPLVKGVLGLRHAVAQHIEFCALTGNEARGLDILNEHLDWLSDRGADANLRVEFLAGVCVLLRRLVALGRGDMRVGEHAAAVLLSQLTTEIDELCARYDARNGTDSVGVAVRARLDRGPLVDHLPLGIRAVADLRSPLRPTASRTDAGQRPDAERLAEWAVARLAVDPAGAEQRLRRALEAGASVLPAEQLARLSSLLVTAISGQRGRESALADAALVAAWRWEPLSAADSVHHTLVAARAYHRAERHAEAAALFEQPLAPVSGSSGQFVPGSVIPYPPAEIALIRRQFGESLNALNRYRDAAAQFAEAARLIDADPQQRELTAELVHAEAAALSVSGRDADALVGYLRAADLFAALERVGPRARSLRSAAWLQFWGGESVTSAQRVGLATMRALLEDLERLAHTAASPEIRGELLQTRRQLDTMREEANAL